MKAFRNTVQVAYAQFGMFFVGSGGFGGKRTSEKTIETVAPPSRVPDKVVEFPISIDQVLKLLV